MEVRLPKVILRMTLPAHPEARFQVLGRDEFFESHPSRERKKKKKKYIYIYTHTHTYTHIHTMQFLTHESENMPGELTHK